MITVSWEGALSGFLQQKWMGTARFVLIINIPWFLCAPEG